MSEPRHDHRWVLPGPSLRDWGLLGIGLILTAGGVLLIARGQVTTGAFTAFFFGLASLFFGLRVARLMRTRRPGLLGAKLPGGVEIGLSRWRLYLLGAALAGMGGLGLLTPEGRPLLVTGMLWFVIAVGFGLIAGLALNLFGRQSLMLTEEGLVAQASGQRFVIGWDNFARLALGDYARNPMIFIEVQDLHRVRPLAGSTLHGVLKKLAGYDTAMNCDFSFMPLMFGLDPQLTLAALMGYVEHPETRAELSPKARVR